MKIYKIKKSQLGVIWVTGIIIVLLLLGLAFEDESIGTFIGALIIIATLTFYTIGWKDKRPKATPKQNHIRLTDEQKQYIKKWSWGAAMWPFFWALGNRLRWYWILLFVVPIVVSRATWEYPLLSGEGIAIELFLIAFAVAFGLSGRRLAWNRKKKWESFDQFKQTQHGWDVAGIVALIIIVLLFIIIAWIQYDNTRKEARDMQRISDVNNIRTALEVYYDTNNYYPNYLSDLKPSYLISSIKDPVTNNYYGYKPLKGPGHETKRAGVIIYECPSLTCKTIGTKSKKGIVDVTRYNTDWYTWEFHYENKPDVMHTGYLRGSDIQKIELNNERYHVWANLEKWHTVLDSDADRISSGVDGSKEACNGTKPAFMDQGDCIYDLGYTIDLFK